MYYTNLNIRNRKIILIGDENGLSQLLIDNNTKQVSISETWQENSEFFNNAKKQLQEYFDGVRTTFELKLAPKGTDYQQKIWKSLCDIPYGELRTYKNVAILNGNPNASRAIGLANNRNPIPIIIPCHRVIGSNKKLVGYAYGLDMKKDLIEHETINMVFHKLSKTYKVLNWWPADNDFEMMVGAVLTQNTNWKNVEKALANIGDNLSPEFIKNTPEDQLANLIRPSGYHNQKAIKLKALCEWFEKYNFDINNAKKTDKDTLRKELLSVFGIGEETADSILVYALDKCSFVIDAYTRRIFHRVGIDVPKSYENLRLKMEKHIHKSVGVYKNYHGLIVEHAKAYCTKTPQCKFCPIEDICQKKSENIQNKLIL